MPKFFLQKSQWLYALLTFFLTLLFIDLALNCYYSDSEIWLITLSQKVFSPDQHIAIYYKWFFHLLTYLSTAWTSDNIWTFQSARFFYSFISLLALALNSFVFCKVFDNKKLFFPLFIIHLTSSLFFNQAFRIRADIIALLLHTIFLWIVTISPSKKLKSTFVLTTLNCFLVLSTPKAIIFLFLQGLLGLLYMYRDPRVDQKEFGRAILLSLFYPLCFTLFIISFLIFLNPLHPLLLAIHSAIDFYLKSFDPSLAGASFFKPIDFMYLIRFFKKSPIHAFLFLFWLVTFFISLFSKKTKTNLKSFFRSYSALLFILILLYNQKLPFFLASFLVPLISFQFGLFIDFVNQRQKLSFFPPLLLLVAAFFTYKQYLLNSLYNNNQKQRLFISQLQEYKEKNPSVTVYDIIGLLPQNNTYYIFMGPGEVSHREQTLNYIETLRPDIYLYTFKNIFFEPQLKKFLEENYFQETPGVWLRAKKIDFRKGSLSAEIIRVKNKNYWLIPINRAARIFEMPTKKEISSSCLYIDSYKNVSQKPTDLLAIPLPTLHVSIVEIPLPQFTYNPYDLFRFDTAF